MSDSPTPMLKQYHALKAQHQDCILFFRLGDFYEMFYEDAKVAAAELDLVLTARGKTSPNRVPMCGFPHHSAEGYIAKLIKAGHKVAICEQIENPAEAQGIVKRDVTRIISSGTYLDENNNDTRFLLSIFLNKERVGIAFTDPVSGSIQTNEYVNNTSALIQLVAQLPICECIFAEAQENDIRTLFTNTLLKSKNISLSSVNDWSFNPDMSRKNLLEHFTVANLHGFGIEDKPLAIASCGALLDYLKSMNKQPLKHIDHISLYNNSDFVFIAPAAFQGLELPSLIRTLDHTNTALGRREFFKWMTHPLKNVISLRERQEVVKALKDNFSNVADLRHLLKQIPDIEKNISRLSCGYTHAKDFVALNNTLRLIPEINAKLKEIGNWKLEIGGTRCFELNDIKDLRELLERAINEDVSLTKPDGKIIKKGFHTELDQLRDIQTGGHDFLKNLQQQEIQKTGISSLKIGFNKVFGYYFEVTNTHKDRVPEYFIRKQTLVNAERYITPELKTYEEKILTAEDKILAIERELVEEIRLKILKQSKELHLLCHQIATIDCLFGLTTLAQSTGYICPIINDESRIDIKAGRHPVVEKNLIDNFIANDTLLDSNGDHLIILTGPNMAGKSTYIRQTAVLTLMAQVGSFIPADSATIGIVDKIFTRIGAHDDINRGQSTFMVEMNETADILNNLTDRSLIILDEIGRGTSTYDGLSLAWALAEHLQQTRARTLFATHFHELTVLEEKLSGVKNYNVAVKEWRNEIIFLHKIIPGSTDDSYGIYVAKLAGIPRQVIERASVVLKELEENSFKKEDGRRKKEDALLNGKQLKNGQQPDLFRADPLMNEVRNIINTTNINELRPIDALNRLQEIKDKLS